MKEDKAKTAHEWYLRNKEKVIVSNQKRRQYGELPLTTMQLVYEDNIKKYGTLTCYLFSEIS